MEQLFQRFQGTGSQVRNWDSVFKTSQLPAHIQTHLTYVYATLALTLLTTAIGTVADLTLGLGGGLTTLGSILLLVLLGMEQQANWQKRVGLLAAYGFLQGCSLGPLVGHALDVDPALLMTAVLGTTAVFVCFSLAAIYSPRRSYLYLGGMLSSALSFMLLTSLFSFFFGRSLFVHNVMLYGGLFVFAGYVIYDSQLIIEKAEMGSKDFVAHALELFIDFVALFVRILIILLQNANKKEEQKNKNKRR